MAGHRWSGWPGAWCMDCGIEDPSEACLGLHDHPGMFGTDEDGEMTFNVDALPPECRAPAECPEPNSHRYDPYHPASG